MDGKPFQKPDPDPRYWERNALQLTAHGSSLVWFQYLLLTINIILAGFIQHNKLGTVDKGYRLDREMMVDTRPSTGVRNRYDTMYPFDPEGWKSLAVTATDTDEPTPQDNQVVVENEGEPPGNQEVDPKNDPTLTDYEDLDDGLPLHFPGTSLDL